MSKRQAIKIPSLFLCITLALGYFFVQNARAETLPIKSYTTSDGLAHDRVNQIVRDSRGFLWFCTAEGLSRFDGYEFKNYTQDDGLPHRAIYDFLETRGGELWIATGDGLVLFDPLGNPKSDVPMFRAFRPADLKTDAKAFSVSDLLEDRNGNIWAASSSGVYQLEKQGDWSLRRFAMTGTKTEDFSSLLEDRSGSIWVGAEIGLYRILADKSGVQTIDPKMRVESLLEDRDGRVWVGSAGGSENEIGITIRLKRRCSG
jgi:ligand-binding sensor domain-containing protein